MASSMGEGLSLTAVARARTGKQWLQFDGDENKRLFPYIEWLPSRSATPRETHRVFWHCRWRKDDNFWKENQPGTLWNCKCDWEQTDDTITPDNPDTDRSLSGLDGNPATTGQLFTDRHPYFKNVQGNRKTKELIEKKAGDISQPWAISRAKGLLEKTTTCTVMGKSYTVNFISQGISKAAQSMNGTRDFWLKNEFLPHITNYISNADCQGRKKSDSGHNTRKQTIKNRLFLLLHDHVAQWK